MEDRLCIEVLEHINVVVSTRVNTFMPFLFFFFVLMERGRVTDRPKMKTSLSDFFLWIFGNSFEMVTSFD